MASYKPVPTRQLTDQERAFVIGCRAQIIANEPQSVGHRGSALALAEVELVEGRVPAWLKLQRAGKESRPVADFGLPAQSLTSQRQTDFVRLFNDQYEGDKRKRVDGRHP
jgi:hypothetical protein